LKKKANIMQYFKRFCALIIAVLPAIALAAQGEPSAAPSCPQYGVEGDKGDNIILIPGLISPPSVWDGLAAALKDTHRVHRVKVAGFAEAPADPRYRADPVGAQIADVTAYIACKKLRDVTLIGHSQGGFLSLKLAIMRNPAIRRVVVVDALPFFPLIFNPAANVQNTAPFAAGARDQILLADDTAFAAQQRQSAASLVQSAADQERLVQWSLASDRETMAATVYALFNDDIRGDLGTISIPVSILYATNPYAPQTRLQPLYESAYKTLPQADFIEVQNSYHFIMLDQPDSFVSAVKSALAGTP
jgi:pimeloyl-ACP methyl ester carboxylesterase